MLEAIIDQAASALRAELLTTPDPEDLPGESLRHFAEGLIRKITLPNMIAL